MKKQLVKLQKTKLKIQNMDKDIASEGKILTTQINKLRQEVDNLWKEIESGNSLDSKNTFKRIDKKNDRECSTYLLSI